jgi:hypothetical protein
LPYANLQITGREIALYKIKYASNSRLLRALNSVPFV